MGWWIFGGPGKSKVPAFGTGSGPGVGFDGDMLHLMDLPYVGGAIPFWGTLPNGWNVVYSIDRSSAFLVARAERHRRANQGTGATGHTGDLHAAGIEMERLARKIKGVATSSSAAYWASTIGDLIWAAVLADVDAVIAAYPEQTKPTALLWDDVEVGPGNKPVLSPLAQAKLGPLDKDPLLDPIGLGGLPWYIWAGGAAVALLLLTRRPRK